jgi:hypothetical protein
MLSAAAQATRHKVLGVLCALPLSVDILLREVMLLHIFAFLPLALYTLWHRRAFAAITATRLTAIDRIAFIYFAWLAFSLVLNLMGLHGDGGLAPRLVSTSATMIYWVLPFLIGRFIFETDHELIEFLEGLMIGVAVTCLILLAGYVYTWFADRVMVRYAIGQRSVLVLSFLSILVIFFLPLRPRTYLLAFLLWLAVALSATRASLGQWLVALFPALSLARNFSLRQRSVLAGLALCAALVSAFIGDAVLRISWMAGTSVSVSEGGLLEGGLQLQSRDDSANIRFHIWSLLAAKAFHDLPSALFGFGQLGPSFVAEPFTYKGHRIEMFSAHSEYLDQILRSGLIGLFVFLALLCVVTVTSFRLKIYPPPLGLAFYGLGFGLVGVAFYSIWHESARYPWFGVIFWLFIGALSSVIARHERPA